MTVSKDKYDNYKAALLAGGVSEPAIELALEAMRAEDAKIDARVCPHCGSKLTRELDPRQSGPTKVVGKWFNYKCEACPWFGDRCEPVGEN